MGEALRLRLTPAVTILGLPLENSENPYLAAPIGGEREIILSIDDGCGPLFEVTGILELDIVANYGRRLLEELGLRACVKLDATSMAGLPIEAVYSSLTAAIIKGVSLSYGERLEVYEILEYARLLDPWERPYWQGAVDAMRVATLKGEAAVYRNDEEYGALGRLSLRVEELGRFRVDVQAHTLEELGSDVYGAAVRLAGVIVLEGAVRVRDLKEEGLSGLEPLLRLQSNLLSYFWGVPLGQGVLVPGLPGTLVDFMFAGGESNGGKV